MELKTWAASAVAFAGVTLGGLSPAFSTAAASAGYSMAPTHIYLDGTDILDPKHVVAKDNWGDAATTWIPVNYLQQALTRLGFHTTWDGTVLTFTKYPAHWTFGAPLGNPEADPMVAPKGDMQIRLVAGGPPSMNIPKLMAEAPASGVTTTYVPIYYVDAVLIRYFKMGAAWNGAENKWNLTSQSSGVITTQSYASASDAATQIAAIQRANSYLTFGSHTQSVNLGLGITAKTDAGLDHQGFQWHEGNWTVEVLWYTANSGAKQVAENIVAYLHTHMLPPPHDRGVIIVNSTDPKSTTFKPRTIIAWQEEATVYQLARSGDPISALQVVVNSNR
ncbi:MAG: hypothetical protein K6T83_11920 [Alicyclobacillus sp.]|nr:hypothetical protein [Alicyclobacillus sp.]